MIKKRSSVNRPTTEDKLEGDFNSDQYDDSMGSSSSAQSNTCDASFDGGSSLSDSEMALHKYASDNGTDLGTLDPHDDLIGSESTRDSYTESSSDEEKETKEEKEEVSKSDNAGKETSRSKYPSCDIHLI